MARTRNKVVETPDLSGTEFDSDVQEAAAVVDGEKPEKAGRERKYNDEIVKRAIELRRMKGLGFHKVARAIAEEFDIEVSPAALRAATLKFKGVDSLNDLAKKAPAPKAAPAPASTKK